MENNLFVKTKENKSDYYTTFEVITRSPFAKKDFELNNKVFTELFKCMSYDTSAEYNNNYGDAMIDTNISASKEDVFKCIDEKFIEKLYWWELYLYNVEKAYTNIYNTDGRVSLEVYGELDSYKEVYEKTFEEDAFQFTKDMQFFRDLFDTAKELMCEERV